MRCTRCGNDNPASNRFCGMCGTTLLPAAAQPGPSAKPPASAPAAGTGPGAAGALGEVRPRTAPQAPVSTAAEAPIVSGPSFLGLNQPAPSSQRQNPLSIDPDAAPSSRNLDYLLDDDEQPKGRAAKFILIGIALALAIGFGYLRWRNQALPWLGSHAAKPAAAAPSSEEADSSSAAAPPSTSVAAAGASPSAATPTPSPADSTSATPSSGASGTSPGALSANPVASNTQPIATASAGETGSGSSSAAAAPPSAAANSTPLASDAAAAPPKSGAAVRPAAIDPVTEAQKYIYGKGVRQDCDRGLRLLKPAANQANSKAMIEMGALYSAGLCTPRDLPTSYRWFAMALRKDPNNPSLQADLSKLWGEMTQPERQLAIRLSQ